VFSGEADQKPDHEAGDVIFVVQEQPHDLFKRVNDDLVMEKDVLLIDSLIGFSFNFYHLDDRAIVVTQGEKDIIKPGDIREVRNLGMPLYRSSQYGNLYIKYNVIFPNIITESQSNSLKNILKPSPSPIEEDSVERVTVKPSSVERIRQRGEQQQRERDNDEEQNQGGDGTFRTNCAQQ